MKRLHVHVAVADLADSIRFYSTLFGAPPTVEKPDYAKWMLDDPRVNLAISQRTAKTGLDHLGIQVDSGDELDEVAGRLSAAGRALLAQEQAACCYARSDKAWVNDPQGVAWETFHTTGEHTAYGEDVRPEGPAPSAAACCAPPARA